MQCVMHVLYQIAVCGGFVFLMPVNGRASGGVAKKNGNSMRVKSLSIYKKFLQLTKIVNKNLTF